MLGSARLLAFVCAIAAAVALPPMAAAQKVPPKFMEHYTAGQTAYHSGKFDEAKKQFQAARAVRDLPGPYRWLAATALAQGRLEDCIGEARGYLGLAPRGDQAAAVRGLHEQCRRALERPPFAGDYAGSGAIWIEGRAGEAALEGVTVRLNGLKYGATPMAPRAVALGSVEVRLEASGYLPATVDTTVVAGIVTDVVVSLARDPTAAKPATSEDRLEQITVGWLRIDASAPDAQVTIDGAPASYDDEGRIEADPGLRVVEVSADDREPWRRRVRFVRGQERRLQASLRSTAERDRNRRRGYLALGVAGAGLAAGAVFGILEGREFERAEDIWDLETQRPANAPMADVLPIGTRAEIADHESKGKTYAIASAAGFGVAAVALGASVYFFINERSEARDGVLAPIAVTPLIGRDGVAGVTATFTKALDW